jgi:hypothetical protein
MVDEGWVCVASEDGENMFVVYMDPKLTRCQRGALSRLPSYANMHNAYCEHVRSLKSQCGPHFHPRLLSLGNPYHLRPQIVIDDVGSDELNIMAPCVCFDFFFIDFQR